MSKFNLGSGPHPLHNYINIDFMDINRPDFIRWDLRQGLPPQCKNADLFTHCHFIEHLRDWEAQKLLRECLDYLKVGGKTRIGFPNFREMFNQYLQGNWKYWDILGDELDRISPKETRSLIDIVSFGVYQYDDNTLQNHKSLWDLDKMTKVLQYIGYREIGEVPYDYKQDPPCELRQRYTIVVEAYK